MEDWGGILLRFGLYATLAPAFGIPLHHRLGRTAPARGPLLLLIAAGTWLSAAALLWLVAAMTGTPLLPVDAEMLAMIVAETPVGIAFAIRFAALAIALLLLALPGAIGRGRCALLIAAAGIALATLAWTGHGAMDEGARGTAHLAADIVHLLAAGAWLGAIACLLGGVVRSDGEASGRALAAFATTGSVLVAVLLATGIVSGWMIAGPVGWPALGSRWGLLLALKLALFAVMLGLAAANRWWLGPRLAKGSAMLRLSLSVELATGLAILALVAWLGTLPPDQT